MTREDIVNLASKFYKEDNLVEFSEKENAELSKLYKEDYNFENELEHYFREFGKTGITEEQRNSIKDHIFNFKYYIFHDSIYLIIDDRLDTSLFSLGRDFVFKLVEILEGRDK